MSCVHRDASRMATFIDIYLPAIISSVDKRTTPSTNTCQIRSWSRHNFSLGMRNTACPLSHIRPRYLSECVGTRSHVEILKKKSAHEDRAIANRRPADAANHCSRGADEQTATGEHCHESSIYVKAGIPCDRKNSLLTPRTGW